MSDDILATLGDRDVAAFYRRLAFAVQKMIDKAGAGYGDSLAKICLLHWLDGGGKPLTYPARYVRNLVETRAYLRDTARQIFLSRRPTPSGMIGGVAPRISGKIKADPATGPYLMHLEGNVEIGLATQARAAMGLAVEPVELDVLYALHGFALVSDVVVSATKQKALTYAVAFDKWTCKATDEYHWNPEKHISVPNPDYRSKDKNAVAPDQEYVTVYHKHAIRIEKAGLAQAFHNESEPWDETDLTVVGPEFVKP
jgi:hypothetical protein